MSEDSSVFNEIETRQLDANQDIRNKLIALLTGDGSKVPENGVLLLGLLDGSDRSVINRAKMKSDKESDLSNRQIVKGIGQLLKSINPNGTSDPATQLEREIPDSLKREFVPGELSLEDERDDIKNSVQITT